MVVGVGWVGWVAVVGMWVVEIGEQYVRDGVVEPNLLRIHR